MGFLAEGFQSVPMSYAIKGDDVLFRLVKPPSTKVHVIAQDLVGFFFFPKCLEKVFFFKVNIFFI